MIAKGISYIHVPLVPPRYHMYREYRADTSNGRWNQHIAYQELSASNMNFPDMQCFLHYPN